MIRRGIAVAGAALLLPVLLGACRDGEQGRPYNLTPGVYVGKADSPVGAGTLTALRDRALYQAGIDTASDGSTASRTADVRPPAMPDGSAIKGRLGGQNF